MKKTILYILMVTYLSINAQKSFIIKSKDGKVSAENFISFEEAVDSVIVKNKRHIFKFSSYIPLINIKDSEGYDLIDNNLRVSKIKKINKKTYLIVAYGGSLSTETQLNLFFIKKNKTLKYYVLKSYDKTLRDVSFEYLYKTKEVTIPIKKKYTPQNYIYDIELTKRKSFDTIKPLLSRAKDSLFYHYKLKIK